MLGTRNPTENLPPQFVTAIRALFDLLDTTHSGYIKYSEFAQKWQESSAYTEKELPQNGISKRQTEMLPKNFLNCLWAVTPSNGMLTFERFCRGLRLALGNTGNGGGTSVYQSGQHLPVSHRRPVRASSVRGSIEEPPHLNPPPSKVANQKALYSANGGIPSMRQISSPDVSSETKAEHNQYGHDSHGRTNGQVHVPTSDTRDRAQKWRYRYSGAVSDSEESSSRVKPRQPMTNGYLSRRDVKTLQCAPVRKEGSLSGLGLQRLPQGHQNGISKQSRMQRRPMPSDSSGQRNTLGRSSSTTNPGTTISHQISNLVANGTSNHDASSSASYASDKAVRTSQPPPTMGTGGRMQPLTSISVDTRVGLDACKETRVTDDKGSPFRKQIPQGHQTEVYQLVQGWRQNKAAVASQSSSGSSARNSDLSSIRHSPMISPNPGGTDQAHHPSVSHAAPVLTMTSPPTYSQTMTNIHHRSGSNQSMKRTVAALKPSGVPDPPPLSTALLRGASTENLSAQMKIPVVSQPSLGARSVSHLTAGDLYEVKLRKNSSGQRQVDGIDDRRHTTTELSAQLSTKHRNLLNEERDLVKRGIDMATKLRNWYSERLQTLDRKQKLFTNKNHPMEFAVQEQRLNYFRAHVAEVNRHIVSLMESKEKNFPSPFAPDTGRAAAQPAEDQVRWLMQQNKQLTQEVSEKSDKLAELEKERSILLQQIVQQGQPSYPMGTNSILTNGHVQYSLM